MKKITIIGAGVIGLACAARLTEAGHSVTLIDKGLPGKGTSFGNAGVIATEHIFPLSSLQTLKAMPQYLLDPASPIKLPINYLATISPWLLRFAHAARPSQFKRGTEMLEALLSESLRSMTALMDLCGAPSLMQQKGSLVALEQSQNIAAAQQEINMLHEHDIGACWLDKKALQELAPGLTPNVVGAQYFTETGHTVNPYDLSLAMKDYVESKGGTILRADIQNITQSEDGVTVSGKDLQITSDQIIIAAGAFSKKLAQQTGLNMPLETERGYHLHLEGYHPAFDIPVSSYERKVYLVPMNTGLRATGIVEFGGLKQPPNPKNYATIKKHLEAMIPDADFSSTSEWMGYRPSLPDHLPALGYNGDNRRILYAFGHQHLGLTLSGITAEIITSLVADETPSMDISALRPDRFS